MVAGCRSSQSGRIIAIEDEIIIVLGVFFKDSSASALHNEYYIPVLYRVC